MYCVQSRQQLVFSCCPSTIIFCNLVTWQAPNRHYSIISYMKRGLHGPSARHRGIWSPIAALSPKNRAQICTFLRSPNRFQGIDSAYVACESDSLESISGLHKSFQIRAQVSSHGVMQSFYPCNLKSSTWRAYNTVHCTSITVLEVCCSLQEQLDIHVDRYPDSILLYHTLLKSRKFHGKGLECSKVSTVFSVIFFLIGLNKKIRLHHLRRRFS